MIRMPGTSLDADTADFLRRNAIRAICLFRQNMVDTAQLTKFVSDLRAVMGPDALIAIDQEGGAVVRATWLPPPPAGMGLGAADDAGLAYEVGAAVARSVRILGFNWNFAPVLDINNNPDNPVIAERSFGAEPRRAAELAQAWMEGSQSQGVACCIKHFPGHGDTHVDSHRDLPTVDKPLATLEQLEFLPFRQMKDKAPAMMTAHIVYPALDAEFPATMSKSILTGLLRDAWQYEGVVITDGMDMHAIAGRFGVGNAAVMALEAGADMVMALGTRETQEETLAALAEAIAGGRLTAEALQLRLRRLHDLAATYPSRTYGYPEEAADRTLMARAWQAALTPYRNPNRPKPGAKVRLVARADVVSDGVSEAGVPAEEVAALLRRFYDVELVTFADAESFDWNALPADGRTVILASTSRLRYGQRARAGWRPDLHLALWNPFQALDISAPALLTYGFAQPALEAVADWLSGKGEANGKCPVAGFVG
ncbi:MAG: glycoside hydrolase family 3 protein [Burkholderiaceae bacterium]|nr:glycoside hydrolase family 3 protein [Burkholderiaceae bacterium]